MDMTLAVTASPCIGILLGAIVTAAELSASPSGASPEASASRHVRLPLLRRIIAPIAIRQARPAGSTEIVLMMVESTAFASFVTIRVMTGAAQRLISQICRITKAFPVATLIYLLINFIIVRPMALVEHRPSPPPRGRPVPTSGDGRQGEVHG